MKKDFDKLMNTLTPQILGYEDLVDTDKVIKQYENIHIDYEKLNSLITDYDNFYNNIDSFLNENKDLKTYLPILFAARKGKLWNIEKEQQIITDENTPNGVIKTLLKGSPLDKLIKEHKIHDVRDYIIGVEAGLDSNARKNRTGTAMENRVSKILREKGLEVEDQYNSYNLCDEVGLDPETVNEYFPGKKTRKGGRAVKRFDSKFEYKGEIYLVETNFYGTQGSKPDEITRAYMLIEDRVKTIKGLHFIWVTDGAGWNTAKSQLEEAYNHIKYVFNLDDLINHSLEELLD